MNAIEVRGLRKTYRGHDAVGGIDSRGAGEVFALLGPNGAGKTTTGDPRGAPPPRRR